MRFLRYFFIALAIAAVSCSKEETSEKVEWSADFGRLVKAYFDGKYFDSARNEGDRTVFKFTDGSSVPISSEDVKVINASIYGIPEISRDARTGEWTLNKVRTGIMTEPGTRLSDSMPICIYYDDKSLTIAMSNGENLIFGNDPDTALTSFGFYMADNPTLVQGITCEINGREIVGQRPVNLSSLKLVPRFTFRGKRVLCGGEEQVSGKTKQDFSSPVVYEVELANGEKIPYTVTLESSVDFPTVFVFTKNNADVVDKDTYIQGTVRIEDPHCKYSDQKVLECEMKIKGRGNSSWNNFPKKPYRIKMDEKHKVFGQPKNKDWILLATYSDKTLLRDMTGMELSRICGMSWTPVFHHVELYFNNEYRGVYLLGDHKEVSKDRVDITVVGPDDNSGEAVTGGYYFEIEQQMDEPVCFWTSMSVPMMFCDPEKPTSAQKAYVEKYFKDFEMALQGHDMADPDNGYAKYIDVDSFVNYYIIQELTKNIDGNLRKSSFLTKERGQKLEMYHVWDFDLTIGNCNYFQDYGYGADNTYKGFFIKDFGYLGYGSGWFVRLFEDPAFREKVKFRWNEIKPQLAKVPDFIDSHQKELVEVAGRNFRRWPILNTWVWPNVVVTGSYQGEVDYMKNFYTNRLEWLDAEINKL